MARSYLSILIDDTWLTNKLSHSVLLTNYVLGYVGDNENSLVEYLLNDDLKDHILFIRPSDKFLFAFNETYLRSLCKIDVIIIGPPLAHEQIALIQSSSISGYITTNDINRELILDIIQQLYKNGFYVNEQIPLKYWLNRPKKRQIIPSPKFTKREKEILTWICHDHSSSEIASFLQTGTSNIRNHVARLKKKTYTKSSNALIALSVKSEWVKITPENFQSHSPFLRNLPNY